MSSLSMSLRSPPAALVPLGERVEVARQALQTVPWMRPLEPAALACLAQASSVRRHVRNDRVLLQDELPQHLLVLLEGHVHAERVQAGRPAVLLQVVRPFDCMGDTALLDGQPLAASCRAVRPSLVLAISREGFAQALHRWPALCARFTAQMSRRLRAANERVSMLARCSVEERVLATLREWAEPNATGAWVVNDPISQHELATVVAASREMTARALAQLKLKGLIWFDGWRQVVVSPAE